MPLRILLEGGRERLRYFLWKRESIQVDGPWLKDKLEELIGFEVQCNEELVSKGRTSIGDVVGNQIGLQHIDFHPVKMEFNISSAPAMEMQ